jgi:hypothetical protein
VSLIFNYRGTLPPVTRHIYFVKLSITDDGKESRKPLALNQYLSGFHGIGDP